MRTNREPLRERLKKIPHLFAKVIIIHCLIVVTVAAYYSLYRQGQGIEMVGIFAAIAAPFVTELAMLLLKTILKKEKSEKKEEESDEI